MYVGIYYNSCFSGVRYTEHDLKQIYLCTNEWNHTYYEIRNIGNDLNF